MVFEEIGAGVFRRRYELLDQNIGVVVGERGVLVVDTRSLPSHAVELVAELRRLTALPIRWVVNTHWHWDHVLGNSKFAGSAIWGHMRCRQVLQAEAQETKDEALRWLGEGSGPELAATEVVAPDEVLTSDAAIDLGGRVVQLAFRGKGHTDSDVTARVGDILFAGDLLEESAPPSFGDSYPLQWPDTIAAHVAEASPRLVVPGHGDVMDAAAVAGQVDELRDVAARCAAASSFADLDVAGAPYPELVMQQAFARSRVERSGD